MGTIQFLYPHYFNTSLTGPYLDIWSAGVLFYLLVAGLDYNGKHIYPHSAKNPVQFLSLFKNLTFSPPILGVHRPDLPSGFIKVLDHIILGQMLQFDPNKSALAFSLLMQEKSLHAFFLRHSQSQGLNTDVSSPERG